MLKNKKADFIQGAYYNGVLQRERETGLNSKYNKEKWQFIAKEQRMRDGRG